MRACSVMVKRYQSSSFSLIHDVNRDKIEDQLLYRDVSVSGAVPGGEMGARMMKVLNMFGYMKEILS